MLKSIELARAEYKKGWGPYPDGNKEAQMKTGCSGEGEKDEDSCDFFNTLVKDLASTYYWSGDFCKDYRYFVLNWHPTIGIFAHHPNHPWSRRERLMMLFIQLATTLVPSAFIGVAFHNGTLKTLRIVGSLCISATDIITGVFLYQLSVLDARCPYPGIETAIRIFKNGCFCLAIVWSLSTSFICAAILGNAPWDVLLRPLLMGKLYSIILWFPLNFVLPIIGFAHGWYLEKKALEKGEDQTEAHPIIGSEA